MEIPKRLKETRLLKFKHSYAPSGSIIYKAGETHAVHKDLVLKIKKRGASFEDVTPTSWEEVLETAKEDFEKSKSND